MAEIILSRDLLQQGYTSADIQQMVRSGKYARVRHGALRALGEDHDAAETTLRSTHRQLVMATVGQCSPDAVVSHQSAAALLGLPIWTGELERVQLTRNRSGGGATRRWVRLHGHPIAADEITVIDGISVTTAARTVLDLACSYPMDKAVAVGDYALRMGATEAELDYALTQAGRRNGISAARRVLAFLDVRSGSVGESRSRVLFHQQGIAKPDLQFAVEDEHGRVVAQTDFGWEDRKTVGEFDGLVKYQRKLRPGHDPEKALFREKQREDRIRDAGYEVVRWINADIDKPAEVLARLNRAFDRGRRFV